METELKVKLEDIVLLGESITKLAPEVYGLHRKIVNGQEPKTPTEEQLISLYQKRVGGYACDEIGDVCYLLPYQIKEVILEWEKIRGE